MKIYTIMTFRNLIDGGTQGDRVIGYFRTLKKAQRIVEDNIGDINEDNYYPYAVIEEVEHGIYPVSTVAYYYHWNGEKYVPIDKPKELNHIVSVTMG